MTQTVMKAAELPHYYNAVDILERNLPTRTNKMALYSHAREMTFGEVACEVNQVGNALKQLGVRFGDYVGILAPDSAEWVTAFFGIIKIGAIAIGLNTLLQTYEYDYILRDSRARILIVHESLVGAIEPIRDQHPTLQQVIVIGQPLRSSDMIFETWIREQATTLAAEPTHREDFCSLHYTSGTTGEPKGVLHAHKDYPLVAQLSGVNLFGITEKDRTFSTAKLFFVYGLGGALLFPWYVGAGTVLYEGSPRMASALWKTLERFQPTILVSVPTIYIGMMTVRHFAQRYNFSALRLCLSAGEALPAAVWHRWRDQTGLEILDTIGCTESLHTFLANRKEKVRPGSSGQAFPGYEIKIVDDDGFDVLPGVVGNLMVKGESIALAYLHHYEKSRHTFRGEWLYTGDKYSVDEDGYYWHAGRGDDMFKVGGLWVSPVEVEGVLTSHAAVRECAIVAHPDQSGTLKAKAFVALLSGYTPSNELTRALLQHCGEQLTAYKCPRWIDYVTELPKTATGKIQRFKLRTQSSEAN